MEEPHEIQFELTDDQSGLRAIFATSAEKPGEIRVSVWDKGRFRSPSEGEMQQLDEHPLSGQIRCDLVKASGEQWASWEPFVLLLMQLSFRAPVAEA